MPTLPLKDIPDDVKKYILKVQGDMKSQKCVSQYSLTAAIFKIIREHRDLTTSKKESKKVA